LDALESIGVRGHLRICIEVVRIGGGVSCAAVVYVKSLELATPAHTEYLDDYQERRFIAPNRRL
jgi:hypothetical protein